MGSSRMPDGPWVAVDLVSGTVAGLSGKMALEWLPLSDLSTVRPLTKPLLLAANGWGPK